MEIVTSSPFSAYNSSITTTITTITTVTNATLCSCENTSDIINIIHNNNNRTTMTSCCLNDVTPTPIVTNDVTTVFYPWDNPHNLISLQTLRAIERIVTCGLNPMLLAVGLPCNVLCCLVFWRQGLGDRMNVSLFSLALVDLCCIFFWFLLGSFCLVGHLYPGLPVPLDWWKWTVRKYVRGFHRGFLFSSGCLTMLISVERCVCVALPLKATNLIATSTMTSLIVIIVTSLHLLCLVYPFKFDVIAAYDEGKTIINLPDTPYYLRHKAFLDILENYVIMTVIPFVTFVVVTIATLVTVLKLRQVMSWRDEVAVGPAGKKSQVALVKMLVIVSCIYIITASPNIVLGIIRSLDSNLWLTGKYRNTFVASHLLYLALGTVNSTVNFFVYVTRSSRFRAHLFAILPLCCSSRFRSPQASHRDVISRQDVTSTMSKPVTTAKDVTCARY